MMDDYVSESDSDYTSYWRDWVSEKERKRERERGGNSIKPRGVWGFLRRWRGCRAWIAMGDKRSANTDLFS